MASEHDLIDELKRKIKFGVTQTAIAEELEISPSYLNEILHGKKRLSEEVAERMGYERVFVKKAKKRN